MIDRRYLRDLDWLSLLIILIISFIGLLTVLSATYKIEQPFSFFFKKQLFGVISGLMLYVMCCFIDYRTFQRWGYFLYFGIMAILAITIVLGTIKMGGQRWIGYGVLKFQPSEFVKLLFAPFLSYYLLTEYKLPYTFKTFTPLLGVLFLTSLLIAKQPDLGTALIILFSGFSLLWLAGVDKKFFLYLACASLILAPIGWKVLKPYQKKRITVFLGEGDKKKERYQLEQSKIAIGSGGLWGKGFLKGTQNKLNFLPESRTDCIFSVFSEEWGFFGNMVLIALYLILFTRLFILIFTIRNFYTQLLAAGLVVPFALSTVTNIGMVSGLSPIVGIPLPFMTYGTSHLWVSYLALGFFQSIMVRRFSILS